MRETRILEFKETITNTFLKTVSAFSNYDGGTILFGVDDDPMGNSRFSDRWIEDASYLKFKRLMLSYDIPFQTSFLQNISVWAAVNNVCTLTKYLGGDPEFSYGNSTLYQGVDAGYIPQSRSFQLGVNISL